MECNKHHRRINDVSIAVLAVLSFCLVAVACCVHSVVFFFSSSGVVTSSESLPKSNYSANSDLSGSNTPLPVVSRSRGAEQSPDSGIASPVSTSTQKPW